MSLIWFVIKLSRGFKKRFCFVWYTVYSVVHYGQHCTFVILISLKCNILDYYLLNVPLFLIVQVLSSATIVAKHTSALCNACRLASSKTSNPVARRQFVQSAKEVANTTANLVKTIKVRHCSPTRCWA